MIGRDLLGMEDLDRGDIERILDTAERMREVGNRVVKKVPTLRGRTVVNLFFESSTRTLTSFETSVGIGSPFNACQWHPEVSCTFTLSPCATATDRLRA